LRRHVLADARLGGLAGRFVRLDVDVDDASNASFLERFPVDALPAFLVIDASTETAVLSWTGTLTVDELLALAADGERAVRAAAGDAADEARRRADRLLAGGDPRAAVAAYREAVRLGGLAWPGRARAAESMLQALAASGDGAGCAAAALDLADLALPAPGAARAAAQGLACAGAARDRRSAGALEAAARAALARPGVPLEDRCALHAALVTARFAEGDARGARALAQAWLGEVEAAGLAERDPAARAALDPRRVEAARRLGAPVRALPALEASARALPEDDVPAARLAALLLDLGRPAEALRAAERAATRAGGARRAEAWLLASEALVGLGRRDEARTATARAAAEAAALPAGADPRGIAERARRRAAELGDP